MPSALDQRAYGESLQVFTDLEFALDTSPSFLDMDIFYKKVKKEYRKVEQEIEKVKEGK